MINHFLFSNSSAPFKDNSCEQPLTRNHEAEVKTNDSSEFTDNVIRPADLIPGRFEQSIAVGSPDDLF